MPRKKNDDVPEWVYYFSYNLHMNPEYFTMLGIDFIEEGLAILPDYSISFNVLEDEFFRFENRGIANIVPNAGQRVEGLLYRVRGIDIEILDDNAGVIDLKYYRKAVNVNSIKAETIEAFTYAGWPDKTANNLCPSAKYLSKLIQAAAQIPTSQEFQKQLKSQQTA